MRIIAIGAHLDDIEVACGGTLASAALRGHSVRMVVLSQSDYGDLDGTILRTKEEALAEGRAAALLLGVDDLVVLNHPTKDIPYHSTVVEQIELQIREFEPDLVLAHWAFDTHQAHQGAALSTISAARRQPSLLMCEPLAPAGRSYVAFRPQIYVDVSETLDRKLDALRAHESQHRRYGDRWLDAIRARALHRGYEAGHSYAEAFEVLRYDLPL